MTRWRTLGAVLIAATVAAVATGTAGAVTPIDGGDAGGTPITINNGPGDQSEPHVSGNLAVYTDRAEYFLAWDDPLLRLPRRAATASYRPARRGTATSCPT